MRSATILALRNCWGGPALATRAAAKTRPNRLGFRRTRAEPAGDRGGGHAASAARAGECGFVKEGVLRDYRDCTASGGMPARHFIFVSEVCVFGRHVNSPLCSVVNPQCDPLKNLLPHNHLRGSRALSAIPMRSWQAAPAMERRERGAKWWGRIAVENTTKTLP